MIRFYLYSFATSASALALLVGAVAPTAQALPIAVPVESTFGSDADGWTCNVSHQCYWANDGENGKWHNITVTRSYHDGEKLRDSTSFGVGDLLAVAKLVDLAHTWCIDNKPQN